MSTPSPGAEPVRLRDSQTLRLLFWPAVWLTLFLMAFATWRLYWKVQLQSEIAKVREAGYPASPAELEAWYKKPEGENAADYWIQAHAAWKEDQALEDWLPSMTTVDPGAGILEYEEPKLGEQYPDEVFDKMREYFGKNEAAFALMEKAAKIEGCRWPGDYSKGIRMLIPYLGEQKRMANRLGEKMRLAGRDGDGAQLKSCMACGLELGGDLADGRNWIQAIVGFSVDMVMLKRLEEALPSLHPSSDQLVGMQTKINKARRRMTSALASAFYGETGAVLEEGLMFNVLWAGSSKTPEKAMIAAWRLMGGEDHDQAKICAFRRRSIALLAHPETARWGEVGLLEEEWKRNLRPWELGCEPLGFFDATVFAQHLSLLSHLDTATTALAAERHRLDTGHLPEKLDDLVPKYLPAVPPDLFDSGKPLKYKVEADRFTVYSVGKNGTDEGGADHTDTSPKADDIGFTILLPNAKRGFVPKRKVETEAP